jgi:uncharacterized protein
MNLSPAEIRVLGCLLEKQRTTPDQYPLTLNGLRLACNQSTNRDPVVDYDDAVLRDALHRLERRGYTRLASGAGSRAPKYRHLLADALPMSHDEHAVMCVLMLRGPQTPGELKQRADRMHPFGDLSEVHATLERLIERGLVACLPRRPGQKEERYAQLLQEADADGAPRADGNGQESVGEMYADTAASSPLIPPLGAPQAPVGALGGSQTRLGAPQATGGAPRAPAGMPQATTPDEPAATASAVAALERRVATLERELAELRAALGEPVVAHP